MTMVLSRMTGSTMLGIARRGRAGADVLQLAGHRERADSGRTGAAAGHMTIYAQMPDMLALNVKGQVRVADVTVGTLL
jgi:hypothetical protein